MTRAGLDAELVTAAAAAIADADGLEAVTLAGVAQRLGVRPPSLYVHVGGLEDLRQRLAARGSRELREALAQAAAGRSGRDALQGIAGAYRRYATDHPGTYAALQRVEGGEEAQRLVALVLAVLDGYGLTGEEAVHATRIVRSALHGFVALEATGGFRMTPSSDDTFAALIEVLDRGLHPGGR